MSRTEGRSATPKAVIHKRILDAAESEPSASMAEIASGIGGASTELVEKVLEQYGDPGTEGTSDEEDASELKASEGPARSGEGTMDTGDDLNGTSASTGDAPEIEETVRDGDERTAADSNGRSADDYEGLTEGQVRALRLVERNPDASQGEIAEEFDVTRATISRWLSDVLGFEWSQRAELAPRILNGERIEAADEGTAAGDSGVDDPGTDGPVAHESSAVGSGSDESGTGDGDSEPFAGFDRRLERIEQRLDRLDTGASTGTETGAEAGTEGIGPDLAHKVVHACLNSDLLSEEEELRLLKALMS